MMCPSCGKDYDLLYENLCLSCFLRKLEIQKISLRKCKNCNKYFVSNRSFLSEEEAIEYYRRKFLYKKIGELINILPAEKIKISEKKFVCNECKNIITRKIEAIVQLRGENVENVVREFGLVGKKVEHGYDVNFSLKRYAYDFINEIKKRYNLLCKVSKKLIGVKSGKRVYRDTILVRIYGKKV